MLTLQQLQITLPNAFNELLVQIVTCTSLFLGIIVFFGEEQALNQVSELVTSNILWVLFESKMFADFEKGEHFGCPREFAPLPGLRHYVTHVKHLFLLLTYVLLVV